MAKNIRDFTPCRPPAGSRAIKSEGEITAFTPVWLQDGPAGWWALTFEEDRDIYVYYLDMCGELVCMTVEACIEQGYHLYTGGDGSV